MTKITIKTPATINHGTDLAVAAIVLAVHCEAQAGRHDQDLRQLFEGAVDLLQRQAKRVAMLGFDEADMRACMDEARGQAR